MGRARPAGWNDDVRWLLERVAGLAPGDGKGTDSSALPKGTGTSGVIHYATGTHAVFTSSGEVAIQLPLTSRMWLLAAFSYDKTAGASTKLEPRLGQAATFVADGSDERVHLSRQSASNRVNIVFQFPIPFFADADSRVYFRPGHNSGADNVGTYHFWFIQGIATDETA